MKKIAICRYCKKMEQLIRRENKEAGYRIPCSVRDTPKGFHSFKIIEVEDED